MWLHDPSRLCRMEDVCRWNFGGKSWWHGSFKLCWRRSSLHMCKLRRNPLCQNLLKQEAQLLWYKVGIGQSRFHGMCVGIVAFVALKITSFNDASLTTNKGTNEYVSMLLPKLHSRMPYAMLSKVTITSKLFSTYHNLRDLVAFRLGTDCKKKECLLAKQMVEPDRIWATTLHILSSKIYANLMECHTRKDNEVRQLVQWLLTTVGVQAEAHPQVTKFCSRIKWGWWLW